MHASSGWRLRLAGLGVWSCAVGSTALTSAVQVAVLPAASRTVSVTVVMEPRATSVPASGLCVIERAPAAIGRAAGRATTERSGIGPLQEKAALMWGLAGQVVIRSAVVT